MVNNMEKWALYDKNLKPLNKLVDRDSLLQKGEYHLSVHAWIKKDNKFLIFQRDENKKIFPNFYEPIAGGVNEYESSLDTVIREVKEESGIDLNEEQIIKKFSVVNNECKYKEICDVYVFEIDFNIEDIKIEKGKNKNPRLLTKEEIIKLIDDKQFLPLVIYSNQIEKF